MYCLIAFFPISIIIAFFRKNIEEANININVIDELEKLFEKIDTLALQQKVNFEFSIGYIVESICRIGNYAEDIPETMVNYFINEYKLTIEQSSHVANLKHFQHDLRYHPPNQLFLKDDIHP